MLVIYATSDFAFLKLLVYIYVNALTKSLFTIYVHRSTFNCWTICAGKRNNTRSKQTLQAGVLSFEICPEIGWDFMNGIHEYVSYFRFLIAMRTK